MNFQNPSCLLSYLSMLPDTAPHTSTYGPRSKFNLLWRFWHLESYLLWQRPSNFPSVHIKIIFLEDCGDSSWICTKTQRWLAKKKQSGINCPRVWWYNCGFEMWDAAGQGRAGQALCLQCVCGSGGYSSIYISASNICVCFSRALLIPQGAINAAEITRDLMFSWYFGISAPSWKYQESTRSRVILAR